jgi:mannosyltransferase
VTGSARPLGDPAAARAAAPAVAGPEAGRPAAGGRRPAWAVVLPGFVTFAVTMWGAGAASFWRDEAATLSATRRPFPGLIRMLGHVDAVHGAYYLLIWPLAHLAGTGEVAMRLPSAVAMAGAACGVAACGRRLGSWQAGLCGGLVFAALPMTSRYGQEARSYALVTAAAVLASYLLVRAIDAPGRRWLTGYGMALAILGSLNIFALLIIPAHAVTLAAARRRHAGLPRGWVLAVAAAAAVVTPAALLAWRQRSQFAWLLRHKPGWAELQALGSGLAGTAASFVLIAALGVLGAVAGSAGDGKRAARRRIIWLSAPWLVVPTALLFGLCAVASAYQPRYLVFCLPAVALLAGAGLAAVAGAGLAAAGNARRALGNAGRAVLASAGWTAAVALLALLAVLGLPMQESLRHPGGHGDDIRAAAQILRAHARATDDVIYDDPGTRTDSFAYPQAFARLHDISLARTPAAAGNLGGTQASPGVLASRLAHAARVWLIQVEAHPGMPAALARSPFRQAGAWRAGAMTLRLYAR